MATVLVTDQCEIPGDVASLDAFRRWSRSPEFPTTGRIDWVASHIEVDMSPEDIFTHGTVKTAIVGRLWPLAAARGMHLFTGETRVSAHAADLSVEPDVVVVSEESLESGRGRLVPAAGGRPDRFVELEGGPDLVVEIMSDSSARKDTERLPIAYNAAGVYCDRSSKRNSGPVSRPRRTVVSLKLPSGRFRPSTCRDSTGSGIGRRGLWGGVRQPRSADRAASPV